LFYSAGFTVKGKMMKSDEIKDLFSQFENADGEATYHFAEVSKVIEVRLRLKNISFQQECFLNFRP
jgi:hypothetical protein